MKSLKCVIIDDSKFMRSMLRKMIEENKHFTVAGEGDNGHQAIAQAEKHKPHVMTLDITMPDMDGIEAVGQVLKVSPHTRIIMISAMGQEKKVIEAIKHGAVDFIIKPFDKKRVMDSMLNAVSGLS